jgi:hypothetical protein
MAKFNFLGPQTAKYILSRAGALDVDFDALSRDQVSRLLIYADKYEYRKPSNAAGSRARYWHAYLLHRAQQAETRD